MSDSELQRFINGYVETGASRSLLAKIGVFLRAILNMAMDRELIQHNPARKLRAKWRACNLAHTIEECDLLLAQHSGADHVAARLLIQLGLRSEELFALRRNDVQGTRLVIDEAIVDGAVKETKTAASAGTMCLTPDLQTELAHYLETVPGGAVAWLFPSSREGVPLLCPGNFLKRTLKPAAVRAGVAILDEKGVPTSALNFQSLRRTAATLFGARAKDSRQTQSHLRHRDPCESNTSGVSWNVLRNVAEAVRLSSI